MGSFTVGDVVLLPFPYANLTVFKKRPALIVGLADFNNLILCQITSKDNNSVNAIPLDDRDFTSGALNLRSFVRPDKLFTVEATLVDRKLGALHHTKIDLVRSRLRSLFS